MSFDAEDIENFGMLVIISVSSIRVINVNIYMNNVIRVI